MRSHKPILHKLQGQDAARAEVLPRSPRTAAAEGRHALRRAAADGGGGEVADEWRGRAAYAR